MPGETEQYPQTDQRERIWFFPDKFWHATKGMPSYEVDQLMEEVERYAAAKDVEALRKYPFVFVGDPYKYKDDQAA